MIDTLTLKIKPMIVEKIEKFCLANKTPEKVEHHKDFRDGFCAACNVIRAMIENQRHDVHTKSGVFPILDTIEDLEKAQEKSDKSFLDFEVDFKYVGATEKHNKEIQIMQLYKWMSQLIKVKYNLNQHQFEKPVVSLNEKEFSSLIKSFLKSVK